MIGCSAPESMSTMETMERKKPRNRRSFSPGFKADIVDSAEQAATRSARWRRTSS
jgi:hypothetical protein